MTLEELRIQLVDKVKNCRDPSAVLSLLADADRALSGSGIANQARRTFWDAVDHDFGILAQEASVILDRQGALTLRAVIAATRAALHEYRRQAAFVSRHKASP